MEPLRHVDNGRFGAQIFRRTTPQIRNEGGLWDESLKIYAGAKGAPVQHVLQWKFPSGAKISMSHLEYDKTVLDYQGSQIPLIMFDELTHFTEKQFWYMVSRNRSMCGIKPYIRATTNPDADSWVADFIEWWIDQETGLAIPERSGVVRWFVRIGNTIRWADSPEGLSDVTDFQGDPIPPKSATFIAASLSDNKALLEADPGYKANLMALQTVERERLLHGNWKVRPASGLYFKRSWVSFVDASEVPKKGVKRARGWDLASTPKTETNDPDYTSGTKIALHSETGRIYIEDNRSDRVGELGLQKMIANTASEDGKSCAIFIPQDPGAGGKNYAKTIIRKMAGYNIRANPVKGDKVLRFAPFSAQAEAGNVFIVRGPWNKEYLDNLEAFPSTKVHDDDVDSTSEAYNNLLVKKVIRPITGSSPRR